MLVVLSQVLAYAPYIAIAVVLWLAVKPIDRFRYRHIPGPFAWPFLGNMIPIITKGQHIYFTELRAKYGPIFQVWYCGEPWVVISDPDCIRRVAHRIPHRWMPPHTLLGHEKHALEETLVLVQTSKTWRLLKKVWDPALQHRSSLEGYAPLMQDCTDVMVKQLEGSAKQGEVVEIFEDLRKLSLTVTGICAFGIDFGVGATKARDAWGSEGEELLQSCTAFFNTQHLAHAPKWVLPVLMFPSAADWFRRLAYLFPDSGHREMVKGMRRMVVGARRIIAASRAQRQATTVHEETVGQDPPTRLVGKGVLPGSFGAQLEAWKAKHAEAADCSDGLIASQVINFLLGGYETIAGSMAFLVHDLAAHPEAQRKLQGELDTVLGGRKPTLDDLPQLAYLEACCKESLRLGGATPYIGRKYNTAGQAAVPNLSLLGYSIPAGVNLCMYIYSLHRDPQCWGRPEEFLPERFLPETKGKLGPFHDHAHLPFGAGGRKCPGYKFAEQLMALVVVALLQQFSVALPDGAAWPLRKKMGLTFAPDGGVRVHLLPRCKP